MRRKRWGEKANQAASSVPDFGTCSESRAPWSRAVAEAPTNSNPWTNRSEIVHHDGAWSVVGGTGSAGGCWLVCEMPSACGAASLQGTGSGSGADGVEGLEGRQRGWRALCGQGYLCVYDYEGRKRAVTSVACATEQSLIHIHESVRRLGRVSVSASG